MQDCTLYLDSNIYSHINDTGEAKKIKKFFKSNKVSLKQSSSNLQEILRIPKPNIRDQLAEVFTILLDKYDYKARSYYQVKELVDEMERCRPNFYIHKPTPADLREVFHILQYWKRRWKNVQQNKWSTLYKDYTKIKPIVDHGIGRVKGLQKDMRESLFYKDIDDDKMEVNTRFIDANRGLNKYFDNIENQLEKHQKMKCLQIFHSSILGQPSSQDYMDWLRPYIDLKIYSHEDFARFWGLSVDIKNIPKLYLHGIIESFQLSEKVSAGNSEDAAHAIELLDCDYLITADKRFYLTLLKTKCYLEENSFIVRGKPILFDRSLNSVLEQIKEL